MAKPPDIRGVIRAEQEALTAETRISNCPPFVAVNRIDDVVNFPTSLRWSHKAAVQRLLEANGEAFVVDCPSLQSIALWVGTNNDTYRGDYLRFLNNRHQCALAKIPPPFDVDHLYNRSRARMYGLRFIRVALVDHAANRSHGAAYEKDITRNEARRERRDMKLMDEITSMKYFGFLSPLRDDPREAEIEAYSAFAAAKLGLDAAEVRRSIRYLREKASTPWAAKK